MKTVSKYGGMRFSYPYRFVVVFFLFLSVFQITGHATSPCQKSMETLGCLKTNFDELYASDYQMFWKILHSSAEQASTAGNISKLVEFLEMAGVTGKGNAEFEEFFSQTIETVCVNNTEYFLDALMTMAPKSQSEVLKILQNPLFKSSEEINGSFQKVSEKGKYKSFVDTYFVVSQKTEESPPGLWEKLWRGLKKCRSKLKGLIG